MPFPDGIYDSGSICSSSKDIPKYFLFGGELEKKAMNFYNNVLKPCQ